MTDNNHTHPIKTPDEIDMAALETEVEIERERFVNDYIDALPWSDDISDDVKTLVSGNIRAFANHAWVTADPLNKFITRLATKLNERANEAASLREVVKELEDVLLEIHPFARDMDGYCYAMECRVQAAITKAKAALGKEVDDAG